MGKVWGGGPNPSPVFESGALLPENFGNMSVDFNAFDAIEKVAECIRRGRVL